jgi:flagellar hook-length control protein FliK
MQMAATENVPPPADQTTNGDFNPPEIRTASTAPPPSGQAGALPSQARAAQTNISAPQSKPEAISSAAPVDGKVPEAQPSKPSAPQHEAPLVIQPYQHGGGTADDIPSAHVDPAVGTPAAKPQPSSQNIARFGRDIQGTAPATQDRPAGGDHQHVSIGESQPQMTPASARAMQVDAAVRLENATGQPPAPEPTPGTVLHLPATSHAPGKAPGLTADAAMQTLIDHSFPDARLEEPQFSGRIVRGLAAMINQRGGAMTMRLDPPELGELRVHMTLARGVVSAEFQAGTQQAQALLDKSLNMLRSALENQGLTVDRLTVHAAPSSGQPSTRDDSSTNSQNQSPRYSHDAAGGESRGRRDGHSDGLPRGYRSANFANLFDGSENFDLATDL